MTEFITRNHGNKEFEIIIKTDSKEYYKATVEFARRLIDHAKPQTNADLIREMSDEELAKFIVGNAVGEEYQTYEYEFSIENVRYFNVDYEHQGETAEDSVLYWLKKPAEE